MSRARLGLLVVLLVGWSAGLVSAGPFTLDKYNATLLRQVSVVDMGQLITVADSDGTIHWTDGTFPFYGEPMQGAVGYLGWLHDSDGDSLASMRIGAMGTAALANIQTAGAYKGFHLFVANDDDDPWRVRLYVETEDTSYFSGFTALPAGASGTLTLDFGGTIDFSLVTDIGFEVQGYFVPGQKPSNPDYFHVSVTPIPVPGVGLLTLLGVGILGLAKRSRRV